MSGPTIVVKFGDSVTDKSGFVVELDDVLNVDGAGEEKTTFHPGDNIYFRMHYDHSKFTVTRIRATDGDVIVQSNTTRQAEVQQLFTVEGEFIALPYMPNAAPSVRWYGRTSALTRDGQQLAAASVPCLGDLTFNYNVTICRWRAPSPALGEDEEYPLAVVIYVEEAEVV